ncbi:uncharacterized protein EI97DRAFT_82644 [Westerdykella ornata]|uniref:Uncharacterized protein n=1 Tax=Westerdykella ornata TaxID=318751 RepID=A0A6A6JI20_WESOR|nr:uncharacterized protein EI97DRAFT_82644 [Westerdykella ornata]KAF2275286.1 hypothetical protein EI97DRAFT_82644 [Westerdykella ornata]
MVKRVGNQYSTPFWGDCKKDLGVLRLFPWLSSESPSLTWVPARASLTLLLVSNCFCSTTKEAVLAQIASALLGIQTKKRLLGGLETPHRKKTAMHSAYVWGFQSCSFAQEASAGRGFTRRTRLPVAWSCIDVNELLTLPLTAQGNVSDTFVHLYWTTEETPF